MFTSWKNWGSQLALASCVVVGGALAFSTNGASAQITPDSTLPNNSRVTLSGNTSIIEGGTRAGSNLFHSFEQFSVPNGSTADFNNALDIQNIISRVTGGSISNIDGLIHANGSANLFLINPNGIIFGPNARLNIGGSFIGSTASSLKFADGTEFSAKAAQNTPLLTVSVPLGLQFGSNPGNIVNQSQATDSSGETVGLQVQPGRTLALVGGDIVLEGGNLAAPDGRIELGSVAGNSLVSLTATNTRYTLGYQGVDNFQDIRLTQKAFVTTSGDSGGSIQVQGAKVTLTDGSLIETNFLGAGTGKGLTVNASKSVQLIGTSADGRFFSGLSTQANRTATGKAGDLTITTPVLQVLDGAQVSTGTRGSGNGGSLNVNASQSVQLVGESADGRSPSGLSTRSEGTGEAGDLTITTPVLIVSNGAIVGADTFGSGNAGSLNVNASESVQLIGTSADGQFPSGLFARSDRTATGKAGDLTITTPVLQVLDGAQVSVSTRGSGNGGSLNVNASESVQVIGTSANGQFPGGLFARSDRTATGKAGDLTITTPVLIVSNGAEVGADTFGSGNGGSLNVNASKSVQLIGTSADGLPSSLSTQANRTATGKAGDLTITTPVLQVLDGAQVGADTFGSGNGGSLNVNASKSVQLIGTSADGRFASGLLVSTEGIGKAGELTINTKQLLIRDGAQALAATFGSGNGGSLNVNASESVQAIGESADARVATGLITGTAGTGKAGDLTITTQQLHISNGAEITASSRGEGVAGDLGINASSVRLDNGKITSQTRSSNGGNLKLNVANLLLLRRGSEISTSAGTAQQPGDGGNITINAPSGFIVAVPRENNDITANAFNGSGGRVQVNATGIFGITPRSREDLVRLLGTNLDPQRLPTNDITAISQTSPTLNGTVTVNTLGIDPTQGLVNLPTVLVDTTIAQGCTAGGSQAQSEFIITGRGGLPPNPGDALSTDAVMVDLVTLNPEVAQRSTRAVSSRPTSSTLPPIVEAQGWVIDAKGNVTLTANAPTLTPHSSWQRTADCHAFNQQQGR